MGKKKPKEEKTAAVEPEEQHEAEPEVSALKIANNRIIARVTAQVTGLAMKKGENSSFKEIKMLSGNLSDLQDLEGYFGRQVEVIFLIQEDLFSSVDADNDGEHEGNTGVDDSGPELPLAEPPKEAVMCPKCGSPMMVNPGDASQLICQVEGCDGSAVDPDFNEPELD